MFSVWAAFGLDWKPVSVNKNYIFCVAWSMKDSVMITNFVHQLN